MTGRSRQQRLTTRLYSLATRVRHGRFNDAQLRYLQAVLDHYHHAIKEMTTDD